MATTDHYFLPLEESSSDYDLDFDFQTLDPSPFFDAETLISQTLDSSDNLELGLGLGFDLRLEDDQDPSSPLYWDSIQLEEERRGFDEDFEWEEVTGGLDERDELVSAMIGEQLQTLEPDEIDDEEARNVDWEVLLSVNNVAVEDGDYVNPSEFEVLPEQFEEYDSGIMGSPPTAKSVVESLPEIALTKNVMCAVCKDEIFIEEKVKQLPCLHHYHGECILPWLGMRNTCPVCRYELPTDDAEYERWKVQRSGGDGQRYDFEMFYENFMD